MRGTFIFTNHQGEGGGYSVAISDENNPDKQARKWREKIPLSDWAPPQKNNVTHFLPNQRTGFRIILEPQLFFL